MELSDRYELVAIRGTVGQGQVSWLVKVDDDYYEVSAIVSTPENGEPETLVFKVDIETGLADKSSDVGAARGFFDHEMAIDHLLRVRDGEPYDSMEAYVAHYGDGDTDPFDLLISAVGDALTIGKGFDALRSLLKNSDDDE